LTVETGAKLGSNLDLVPGSTVNTCVFVLCVV
jgi:hypothetical protein